MADNSDTEPNIESESDSDDDEYVPKKIKTVDPVDSGSEEEVDDDDVSIAESEDSLVSDEDNYAQHIDENDFVEKQPNTQNNNLKSFGIMDDDYDSIDDEDEDEDDVNYLQKFDEHMKKDTISEYHPELLQHNNQEVESLSRVVRNEQGIISDPLHRTFPFITKYERARILGERAKQLNMGAKPLVEIGPDVIDGYLIALEEYDLKRIPFIIKRPLPNGGSEYWKFKDLEII